MRELYVRKIHYALKWKNKGQKRSSIILTRIEKRQQRLNYENITSSKDMRFLLIF